jgi:hypothetical protein
MGGNPGWRIGGGRTRAAGTPHRWIRLSGTASHSSTKAFFPGEKCGSLTQDVPCVSGTLRGMPDADLRADPGPGAARPGGTP